METPQAVLNRIREDKSGSWPVVEFLRSANSKSAVFTYSDKLSLDADSSLWLATSVNSDPVAFVAYTVVASQGGVEVEICEGITFSGGSEVQPKCRNRENPATHGIDLYSDVSVSDEGTRLRIAGTPEADSPQARALSRAGDTLEWTLAPNTNYGTKTTNLNDSSVDMYVELTWYELGKLYD